MAYKRTTRKTGTNSRSTTTQNTNGTTTQSSSIGGGKGTSRTTSSYNSKTGSKLTQTYTDGNGYVHRKTIFSTAGANKARKLTQKRDAEFGRAIARFFTGGKKTTSAKSKKPESNLLGNVILLILLFWGAYAILN